MERKIAVEDGLDPVKKLLQQKGYQVVNLNTDQPVDAAVITGMDKNMMNMQSMEIDAPLVNAQGRTPEEVLRELESKWRH